MSEKIMVCGYGRHGKDTFCELLGLPFVSSSWAALDHAIWPKWGRFQGYIDKQECFDDRHNHRATWFDLIREYNTPDLTRLGRAIFSVCDVYCGIRSADEFNALREAGVFTMSIWVDASLRLPPEPSDSCTVTPDMCNVIIDNNFSLNDLRAQARVVRRLL